MRGEPVGKFGRVPFDVCGSIPRQSPHGVPASASGRVGVDLCVCRHRPLHERFSVSERSKVLGADVRNAVSGPPDHDLLRQLARRALDDGPSTPPRVATGGLIQPAATKTTAATKPSTRSLESRVSDSKH